MPEHDTRATRLTVDALPGIDETVGHVRQRATELAAEIGKARDAFEVNDFEILDAYVFGSVAAGCGRWGDSDLDIALCVPAWHAPDETVDQSRNYRSIVDTIMARLREESSALLSSSIPGEAVTGIDVWIAEPKYNAIQLTRVVDSAVYFPDGGHYAPDAAAERLRVRGEHPD